MKVNYYYYYNPYQRQQYYQGPPPYYALPRPFAMLVTPDELTKLQGKKIRTTVPNLGSITATVGPYDPNTNRVQLQNIVSVQDGVNHGTFGYLPSDLGGLQILDGSPGTGGGGTGGGTGGEWNPDQLSRLTELKKTFFSFDYPSPTGGNPFRRKRFRVYLSVTVPVVIAEATQQNLDQCMEVAKAKAAVILAPFLTPLTYGGLPGAIPGAISAAVQAFSVCVASNPLIYPYLNRIKLDIKTSDTVV